VRQCRDGFGGVDGDSLNYDIRTCLLDYATQLGNLEGFTGSFPIKNEDNCKVFRCDDTSNVIITLSEQPHSRFQLRFLDVFDRNSNAIVRRWRNEQEQQERTDNAISTRIIVLCEASSREAANQMTAALVGDAEHGLGSS
jgi:hypothetical protein